MKKPKAPNPDILFQAFVGEYVEIILDFKVVQQFNINSDNEPVAIEGPLTVAGFVLDKDDNFLLLSEDGENVNQAIQLKDIKHIAITPIVENVEQLDERMLIDEEVEDDNYN